jgi:hypothetical protein
MLAQISPLPSPEPPAVRPPHLGGLAAPTAVEEPGAGRDQVRLSGDRAAHGSAPGLARLSRGAVAQELQRRLAACGSTITSNPKRRPATQSRAAQVESVMSQVLAEPASTPDDVRKAFGRRARPGDSRPVYAGEGGGRPGLAVALPGRTGRDASWPGVYRSGSAGRSSVYRRPLQVILAGTKLRTRRVVYDELVGLLVESGVASETEALARCRAWSAEVAHAARGRDLVHAARFHELCDLWRAGRHEPSFRRLCLRLKQRLDERRIRLSLPHLQAIASGAVRGPCDGASSRPWRRSSARAAAGPRGRGAQTWRAPLSATCGGSTSPWWTWLRSGSRCVPAPPAGNSPFASPGRSTRWAIR